MIINLVEDLFLGLHAWSNSFGLALIIFASLANLGMAVIGKFVTIYATREHEIQNILSPQIQKIKIKCKGQERHLRISQLFKRYSYHPILSLRSAFPFITQLPFLIPAYYMLNDLKVLDNESFLWISNLAQADTLLLGTPLLPIIMTVINMISTYITAEF
jgi:membrane protein insertase Oxa1/YidC/SpoIIIJ